MTVNSNQPVFAVASLEPIPAYLETPTTSRIKRIDDLIDPPVSTLRDLLPFGQIHWTNFERLCLRLAKKEGQVEGCRLYGLPGQADAGVDVYARRKSDGRYNIYQAKCVQNFGPADIREAVDAFIMGGYWKEANEKTKTKREFIKVGQWNMPGNKFVLCATVSFSDTNRTEAIETCRELLAKGGVEFETWDVEGISEKLRGYPEIVNDFFGRAWVEVFCGQEIADQLGTRLDANQVIDFREKMSEFYRQVFSASDPSLPGRLGPTQHMGHLPVKERFIIPDISETSTLYPAETTVPETHPSTNRDDENHLIEQTAYRIDLLEAVLGRTWRGSIGRASTSVRIQPKTTREYRQRHEITNWLATSERTVILGKPGSGKSTFLRFLAMDLLEASPTLSLLASKWGQFLPVWVPFGWWTKRIAKDDQRSSLGDMLSAWLKDRNEERLWPLVEGALTDNRLLLLIDGLDEWANEDAAKIAQKDLQTFVGSRNVPVIVTSRPQSYHKLGAMPGPNWKVGELAPFSRSQQTELAKIWFLHRRQASTDSTVSSEETAQKASVDAESFINSLHKSPGLQDLAEVPLLLALFISYNFANIAPPQNRFKAYDSLIDHLIDERPRIRRSDARVPEPDDLFKSEDYKKCFAYLAFVIHTEFSEGSIHRSVADSKMQSYLRSDFGLPMLEARHQSNRILGDVENTFGILVLNSSNELGFFHRVFQEYLAAYYISSLPLSDQLEIVRSKSADPMWREVLFSLFYCTRSQDFIREFAETIQAKESSE